MTCARAVDPPSQRPDAQRIGSAQPSLSRLACSLIVASMGCGERIEAPPGAELHPSAITPPPEVVYAPQDMPAGERAPAAIVPAFVDDPDYSQGDPIEARRVVYRVSLRVPKNLGSGHTTIPSPMAELYLDVSVDRLRARFVGTGWPVEEGSEVRIRRDQPGAYVFDGEGGRPLGPGQLARWFEGGRLRREASLRVAVPPTEEQVGPGALICRFIAEWSHTSPDALERRCGEGGTPPSFRVGLWRAYRTADVGLRAPRPSLRADHEDPPDPIPDEVGRAFISDGQFTRLRSIRGARGEPDEDAPEAGMTIVNTSRARMIVTVRGTPIGWVDAGEEFHFPHIPRGSYPVGAMRPLGLQTAQKRPRVVPGRVRLPR